jgi:hypothetical protein
MKKTLKTGMYCRFYIGSISTQPLRFLTKSFEKDGCFHSETLNLIKYNAYENTTQNSV